MYRRDFYLTTLIMAATMIQVWAFMVVLRTEHPAGGTTGFALTITMISAGIAVLAGWHYVFRTSRTHVDRLERT
jgi:hypothetical protein